MPWSDFWESNYFAAWPAVRAFVTNDFVRGGVTGLGVVNLVVGLTELSIVLAARNRPGFPAGDESSGTA